MTLVHEDDWLTLYRGDCRDVLRDISTGSAQAVITSPPYFQLRGYPVEPSIWGNKMFCDHEWGDPLVARQKNNQHVGGRLSSDRSYAGRANRSADAGRLCSKCSAWIGVLGMEPDPWLYVDHLVEVFEHLWFALASDGVAWLNLGDAFATTNYGTPGSPTIKKGDLIGIPWMVAFALRNAGWYLRSDVVWEKPNAQPESPANRPSRVHEYLFLLSKHATYAYDPNGFREESRDKAGRQMWTDDSTRRARDVWSIPTQQYREAHFAAFPEALVERAIQLTTKQRDVVLDPFAGSGTVGLVAQRLSRRSILIDAAADYSIQQVRRAGQRPLGLEV